MAIKANVNLDWNGTLNDCYIVAEGRKTNIDDKGTLVVLVAYVDEIKRAARVAIPNLRFEFFIKDQLNTDDVMRIARTLFSDAEFGYDFLEMLSVQLGKFSEPQLKANNKTSTEQSYDFLMAVKPDKFCIDFENGEAWQ